MFKSGRTIAYKICLLTIIKVESGFSSGSDFSRPNVDSVKMGPDPQHWFFTFKCGFPPHD